MNTKHLLISAVLMGCASPLLMAKSDKRGVSESSFQYNAQLEALEPGVTWYYNWGNAPGSRLVDNDDLEYIPMCWSDAYSADKIRDYVKTHPKVKYLLGFNEPNFTNQADLTPAEAAAVWPAVKSLADELGLELIAPALNYSPNPPYQDPLKWMDEFVALVGLDAFDYLAVHAYGGFGVLKQLATNFHNRYGEKEVWVTEFCLWPDEGNANSYVAPSSQIASMIETVQWLEQTPWIKRYAWFKAIGNSSASTGPNYGLLLSGKGETPRELSEQGKVYVYMSNFSLDVFHDVNVPFPAADYVNQSGSLLGGSNDSDCGLPIEISQFNNGAMVDYQFDVPQAGSYKLVLKASGYGEPTRFDPQLAVYSVNADGTTTELLARQSLTLPNSETEYKEIALPLTLQAGRQTIRLQDVDKWSPSGIRISTITLADDAGVDGVIADSVDSQAPVNVYSLQGILLRQGVLPAEALDNLPAGTYIVGSRKITKTY